MTISAFLQQDNLNSDCEEQGSAPQKWHPICPYYTHRLTLRQSRVIATRFLQICIIKMSDLEKWFFLHNLLMIFGHKCSEMNFVFPLFPLQVKDACRYWYFTPFLLGWRSSWPPPITSKLWIFLHSKLYTFPVSTKTRYFIHDQLHLSNVRQRLVSRIPNFRVIRHFLDSQKYTC